MQLHKNATVNDHRPCRWHEIGTLSFFIQLSNKVASPMRWISFTTD
jgi:hypothetical protein